MTIFQSLGIAGTGLTVYRKWLDAVSDNIANINTARRTDQSAFQARYIVASSIEGGCAVVQFVVNGSVAICAAAAAPISSPWEWPRFVQ
jgi:flagellar basal-body rod protein FlgC